MAVVLYEPTAGQYLADIQERGNPNYVEHNGMTALCVAIDKYRSLSLVKALLREGANVNQQTSVQLWFVFESFTQQKNRRNYGSKLSPLHIALISRQFSIVKLLLEHGADPNAKVSRQGIEPLLLVCDHGDKRAADEEDLEVFKLMVQRGADVHIRDDKKRSLLHRAIIGKKYDMAKYLISRGCNVNDVDMDGKTPLYFGQRDTKCARLLLENCANPNAQNISGDTAYHELMTSGHNESNQAGFLQLLHEFDVDPNIMNSQGKTALHLCLEYLDRTNDIVESVLEYGADTKVKDNLGRTPAFYLGSSCSTSNFKETIGKLSMTTLNKLFSGEISRGRDLNGEPLIHVLAMFCWERNDPLSFERIIECIAQDNSIDINIRDFQNRTALHLLSAMGKWVFAQVLLRCGGNINAKDGDGNTPLHVAVKRKHWNLARELLRFEFSEITGEESSNHDHCDFSNERPLIRSKSVPNLLWTPKCISVFQRIFCLEKNYSNFPGKISSRLSMSIDNYKYLPVPTLSTVISRRINSTSLLETCKEHSVGDMHMEEKCDEEKCLIAKEVNRLVADLVEKCGELDSRLKCNLLLTGSAAEGTKMWLPDEFDFMIELTELKGWCDVEKIVGFPEVKIGKECAPYWSDLLIEKDYFHLSPKKLKEYFESQLRKAFNGLNRNAYPKLWFNVCEYDTEEDFLQTTKVGVKLSLFWLGDRYKKVMVNVDLTPAIPLLDQYKVELRERIISMGHNSYFHIIPCVSRTDYYDSRWRVSFSLAELQLIRSMSSEQVSLYTCLKFLRDIHVLNITEVPSYPLKCCFFNFIFGDEYIDDRSFTFNVRRLLHRLSVHAKEPFSSPRVLGHFFLKDCHFDLTVFDMRWCQTALDFIDQDCGIVQ